MKGLILFILIGLFSANLWGQSAANKFAGKWLYETTKNGRLLSLALDLTPTDGTIAGEYNNVSSKESYGKILSAKIIGNTAIITIDNDWGGSGTVKLTLLKGNRMRWQVIKRDTRKGELIVLVDEILQRAK